MDKETRIIDYIRLIAPEFANVDFALVEMMIDFVKPMVSEEKFQNLYCQAMAYMVCHHLKVLGVGADPEDSGTVPIGDQLMGGSVSEGETSVSFGTNQSINLQSDAELALTIYGLKFLQLRRSVIVPITVRPRWAQV